MSNHPLTTEPPARIPRPSLPPELLERVADLLFQPAPPSPNPSSATSIRCAKPMWHGVTGFMSASSDLHIMGYRRWLQVISVKNADDWDVIIQHIELVSDVWHDEHNRFTYRDVLSALPPSLKRLEIEHAHGPDIRIISLVKEHCPRLEELILGRCTMFNRSPACDFWVSFPHDHDAYMSNIGTDAYAHSLGNELAPLRHLRSLRIGLYFVPPDIVLTHRLYHRRDLPAPEIIDWQTAIPLAELPAHMLLQEPPPDVELATTTQLVSLLHRRDEETRDEFKCPRCFEITDASGREAETSANSILRGCLPTLTNIEWMGWLTPGHLGINSYQFTS
ncbi:hypothetical protein FRC11_014492 [Ceratobasidium sp. 423]|nr:hypothetical protein FRC11_014492 [Ceratobasidium sp. 423]